MGLTVAFWPDTLSQLLRKVLTVSRSGFLAISISTAAVVTARTGTPALTTTGGMTTTSLSGAGTG